MISYFPGGEYSCLKISVYRGRFAFSNKMIREVYGGRFGPLVQQGATALAALQRGEWVPGAGQSRGLVCVRVEVWS